MAKIINCLVESKSSWNETMLDIPDGWGIYKIYFRGFPNNCYIGMASENSGFKKRITQHRAAIWKQFGGVPFSKSNKSFLGTDIREYRKLSDSQKRNYLRNFKVKRNKRLDNFCEDTIVPGESKYIKMMYFMEINNLSLNDICFEILKKCDGKDTKTLYELETEYIDKYQVYISGFNSPNIVEESFGADQRYTKEKNIILFKKWDDVIGNDETSNFILWNCAWNFYQTFKFSYLNNNNLWLQDDVDIRLENMIEAYKTITENIVSYEGPSLLNSFLIKTKTDVDKMKNMTEDEAILSIKSGIFPTLIMYAKIMKQYSNFPSINSDFKFIKNSLNETLDLENLIKTISGKQNGADVKSFFDTFDNAINYFREIPIDNLKGIQRLINEKNNDEFTKDILKRALVITDFKEISDFILSFNDFKNSKNVKDLIREAELKNKKIDLYKRTLIKNYIDTLLRSLIGNIIILGSI